MGHISLAHAILWLVHIEALDALGHLSQACAFLYPWLPCGLACMGHLCLAHAPPLGLDTLRACMNGAPMPCTHPRFAWPHWGLAYMGTQPLPKPSFGLAPLWPCMHWAPMPCTRPPTFPPCALTFQQSLFPWHTVGNQAAKLIKHQHKHSQAPWATHWATGRGGTMYPHAHTAHPHAHRGMARI